MKPHLEPISALSLEDVMGVWYLDDAYAVDEAGSRLYSVYGEKPTGYIHYDAGGRMIVLITHDGRSRLEGDRQAAPGDQRAAAYSTCIAYAGPYVLQDDHILHCIDASTYPNWVGTELLRYVSLENEALVLRTPPQMQNGVITVMKLIWRRMPDVSPKE